MPPHQLQLPVHDAAGLLLGRGDMAWYRPDGRSLLVEADGAAGTTPPQALYRDRRRANDLVATGAYDIVRFIWQDVAARPVVATFEPTLREHLQPR